ncbi:unnamed protein product [Urochloa humidicola]
MENGRHRRDNPRRSSGHAAALPAPVVPGTGSICPARCATPPSSVGNKQVLPLPLSSASLPLPAKQPDQASAPQAGGEEASRVGRRGIEEVNYGVAAWICPTRARGRAEGATAADLEAAAAAGASRAYAHRRQFTAASASPENLQ